MKATVVIFYLHTPACSVLHFPWDFLHMYPKTVKLPQSKPCCILGHALRSCSTSPPDGSWLAHMNPWSRPGFQPSLHNSACPSIPVPSSWLRLVVPAPDCSPHPQILAHPQSASRHRVSYNVALWTGTCADWRTCACFDLSHISL